MNSKDASLPWVAVSISASTPMFSKPISRPIIEQRPSLPSTFRPPLVTRPTMAVLPSAKAASASMRLSKPAISSSTSSSRPNIEAMMPAFFRTLSTTPSSVSVERNTTGAISLNAS